MNTTPDVLIVGGGLAGLSCALRLHEAGVTFLLLEAAPAVGGRVATDRVDGFLLDRGFQVLLKAYPEARRVLDYPALGLRPFYPGALVRFAGKFHRVADPWRKPLAGLRTVLGPIGSLADKARLARLRANVWSGTVADLFARPETTTLEALRSAGFSASMIERFFRPFLGGIFLERELTTSSRMFEFVFRMFAEDDACLPEGGMAAIPRHLADRLPAGAVRTGLLAERVEAGAVTTAAREVLRARAVVVATEGPAAARLLHEVAPPESRAVTCLYFAAEEAPMSEAVLVLNGEGRGPVNNLCVPSAVAPGYAPAGAALVSATVLGDPATDDDALEAAVRAQMVEWFGPRARGWRHLRTYRIRHALPGQAAPALAEPERPVRVRRGVYVCGDHRDNASINGALASGRRAAEAVLGDLS